MYAISLRKRLKKVFLSFETWCKRKYFLTLHFSPKPCRHDGVYISSRGDRYGANSIPWLNAFALARIQNLPLYHHCSAKCFRYRNNVVHKLLVRNSTRIRHCQKCDLLRHDGWFHEQHKILMEQTGGKPLPDVIVESGLKQDLFEFFRAEAAAKHWTLPDGIADSIVVHVRLDDIRDRERPNKQGFIGEEKLAHLVTKLRAQFPQRRIHLVTSPNKEDIATCRRAIHRANVECAVSGNDNIDYDLYLMMCSDILILSRSTFGFVAALLHQGSYVFSYTTWMHFDEFVGGYSEDGDHPNPSKYVTVPQWI